MLRKKFFAQALELFFNAADLLPRRVALRFIQFHCLCTGEPPLGAVHNRGDHLQVANQFGCGPGRDFLLALRFEKQRGIVQNALTDGGRSLAPSRIQLAGFVRVAVMLGENNADRAIERDVNQRTRVEAVSPQRTMGFTLRTVIRPVTVGIGKLFRIALDRASEAV